MKKLIPAAIALACMIHGPAFAEAPPPYPDFTFKRVKPPSAGQKKIDVQITPQLPAVPEAPEQATPGALPTIPSGRYAWYWSLVSPDIEDASPARLEPMVNALNEGPDGSQVAAPRLQHMQEIARLHGIEILKSTVGTQVSPALVLAVMTVESGGRADVESGAGAVGLMQLMPATAERFGVEDRSDPAQNIRGGVAYLNWLMSEFKKDPALVLAAYNAGENAVRTKQGVPPYPETRDYVPKVLAAWAVAKGLCITPPELVSDGCVFRVMTAG
ncbi:lytic transglycosylase, catalytic [Actibacterium atlanticum]|uniref:Lytic transglycosylase, catalytic n=1 Tax=Actibacterium atlanticum TaxID=1461693 RepID=A0A058ZJA7_9RHOB|nr:lytic transglycosylase, catalytic [Actibacterium atlanticum]